MLSLSSSCLNKTDTFVLRSSTLFIRACFLIRIQTQSMHVRYRPIHINVLKTSFTVCFAEQWILGWPVIANWTAWKCLHYGQTEKQISICTQVHILLQSTMKKNNLAVCAVQKGCHDFIQHKRHVIHFCKLMGFWWKFIF